MRMLAPTLGERLVVGVLVVRGSGLGLSSTRRGTRPLVVLELGRRLEVRLLTRSRSGRHRWLVDAEAELHAVQRPGAVLVGFALALPLESALLNDVGRMVALETGGLKLLDAPGCAISPGAD